MSTTKIALLVCFIMVMFLWLLGLLGAIDPITKMSPWLAWFACTFLGVALFVGHEK